MGYVMWFSIVIGVFVVWLLHNYDLLGSAVWNWLAPVGFLVIALASIVSTPFWCGWGKKRMKHGGGECCKKGDGDCKGGSCENEHGMKKSCKCGGEGPCQCPPKKENN